MNEKEFYQRLLGVQAPWRVSGVELDLEHQRIEAEVSTIRSRIPRLKAVARMLRSHLERLLNYILHPITNAVTEGFNSKIQPLRHAARDAKLEELERKIRAQIEEIQKMVSDVQKMILKYPA